VCRGTAATNVPPVNSDRRLSKGGKGLEKEERASTALPKQLERTYLIDSETSRRAGGKYTTICVKTRVKDVDWICCSYRVSGKVHDKLIK
jgi:hypothetical protein